MSPPDPCQIVPAADLAELTGAVAAGEQQLQEGTEADGDADISGLPETTVVLDHADGTRTYLVTDAALYSATGPPGLAKQVAVWLYSRV